jgi:hypothetical protein
MNYTSTSICSASGAASSRRRFEASTERKYNVGIVFKRALGRAASPASTGLGDWLREAGQWVVEESLLRPGTQRRNWLQTLVSDGWIMVRHPRWSDALELAELAATQITLYAG